MLYSSKFLLTKASLPHLVSSRYRLFSTSSLIMGKKALLVGVFEEADGDNKKLSLSKSAQKIDTQAKGNLTRILGIAGPLKKGQVRVLYDLHADYQIVSAVGLGSPSAGYNAEEDVNEAKENVRIAVAAGARALRDLDADIDEVVVDDCHDAEAAAEGGVLGLYYFDELKSEKYKKKSVKLTYLNQADQESLAQWQRGVILSNGQNIARRLMEMPANLMTPTIFAETVAKLAKPLGVTVHIRDRKWAEEQKMNSYLSVSNGSDQPPIFLELHYNNAPEEVPLALVGKGICFDSGGVSIKPSAKMDKMRADMGGAANVVAAIITLATLKAKVNVIGLTPLCENLVNGRATKPGDVVFARNGKSIQIDNTDAEGRLILADALDYANVYKPRAIVDLATLTGAMAVALGSAVAGVFSTSTPLYEKLREAGVVTGDRVWRMPILNHYTKHTTDSILADTVNISKCPPAAGACIAAAFLKEFVTNPNWMHIDIAGVMENVDEVPYLSKGMAGRPMRTLVQFVQNVFSK